jgi:hypothetical protein
MKLFTTINSSTVPQLIKFLVICQTEMYGNDDTLTYFRIFHNYYFAKTDGVLEL